MTNSQFLTWLSDRMVKVYGESPNVDFVLRLKSLASRVPNITTRDDEPYDETELTSIPYTGPDAVYPQGSE